MKTHTKTDIFTAYYLYHWDYKTIAKQLDKSVNEIRQHIKSTNPIEGYVIPSLNRDDVTHLFNSGYIERSKGSKSPFTLSRAGDVLMSYQDAIKL
jgi:hypothetical protein